MSTATELQRIINSKVAIKTAIEGKGVTVGTGTIDTYAAKIDEITTGSAGWTPPADWQDITSTVTNQVKLLVADTNLTYAFNVVTNSGTWSVDWGDGTSTNGITSNTVTQHTYVRGAGVACSRGYTTFVISIKSDTGNVTAFNVRQHNKLTVRQQHDILWANISKLTNLTTCANMFYDATGNDVYCTQLESVILPTTWGGVTSCYNMFYGCYGLHNFNLPTSWGGITNLGGMFQLCYSLQNITLPSSWGSVTNLTNMFTSCESLEHITLPSSWGLVSSVPYLFYNCHTLHNVTLPTTWGSVNSATYLFGNCYSLQNVTLPSSWGVMVWPGFMFEGCLSLQTAILPTAFANTMTLPYYMFNGCNSVQYNEGMRYLGSLTQQANFESAFVSTQNIEGTLSFNSLMSKFRYAGTAGNLNLITGIRLTNPGSLFAGTSPQIDVSYNNLNSAAIAALFNDLPTLTGKTIRITGCVGAADTSNDAIATGKGWTINRAS